MIEAAGLARNVEFAKHRVKAILLEHISTTFPDMELSEFEEFHEALGNLKLLQQYVLNAETGLYILLLPKQPNMHGTLQLSCPQPTKREAPGCQALPQSPSLPPSSTNCTACTPEKDGYNETCPVCCADS